MAMAVPPVASFGKGLSRIRGDLLERSGRAEGLSSDTVGAVFEDREGIVWAATTNGIDSFHNQRVVTFWGPVEKIGK